MNAKFSVLIIILALMSCGSEPEQTTGIDAKLKELETLKTEMAALSAKIKTTEDEIIKMDPSRGIKPKLVSTATLTPEGFNHYIDLQGVVSSKNISYVAPRNGMGGYVKQLYIKAGQNVKKGQLIMKLDDQVLRQSIESVKTQLGLAKNIYDRTKNLWTKI